MVRHPGFSESAGAAGRPGQVPAGAGPKGCRELYDRLLEFQHEHQRQKWVSVRIVHNWNLLLVEEALAICISYPDSPAHGYKLAADYCQNYDPSYGTSLNGPSRTKLLEMVRFMFAVEAHELENSD